MKLQEIINRIEKIYRETGDLLLCQAMLANYKPRKKKTP